MRLAGALLIVGLVALVVVQPPLASAQPKGGQEWPRGKTDRQLPRAEASDPLYVPNAFRLEASNGFTLDVIGQPAFRGHAASLTIYASRGSSGARYTAPATITETSMHADLGDLGEVALDFKRTHRATKVPCGKRKIAFDSGLYEGTFRFFGEEGFTSAEARSLPGNLDFELGYFCAGGKGGSVVQPEVSTGAPLGAALYVRGPALGAGLSVRKRRPGAAAQIDAWFSEYANGIIIDRYLEHRIPSGGFTYDHSVRRALVHPPAPFSGTARFDQSKKAGKRWSGNLAVDLPGKPTAPLIAPSLRATLRPIG